MVNGLKITDIETISDRDVELVSGSHSGIRCYTTTIRGNEVVFRYDTKNRGIVPQKIFYSDGRTQDSIPQDEITDAHSLLRYIQLSAYEGAEINITPEQLIASQAYLDKLNEEPLKFRSGNSNPHERADRQETEFKILCNIRLIRLLSA